MPMFEVTKPPNGCGCAVVVLAGIVSALTTLAWRIVEGLA